MSKLIAIAVVIVGLLVLLHVMKRQRLMKKYGDKRIVDLIMRHTVWQGQTAEQVIDSMGRSEAVDRKVLKTKTKEVWKCQATGKNRYAVKVILEDDVVIGWEKKGA